MACKILIEPEAELDLAEAFNWYDKQQPGLGEEFLACVDEAFNRIFNCSIIRQFLNGPDDSSLRHCL